MTTNQKVEQEWETPSYEDIPNISKMHVQALESSDADEVWVQAGMHHVLLHTVGRKSGKVHKVALPTWNDPNGNRIVVEWVRAGIIGSSEVRAPLCEMSAANARVLTAALRPLDR